MSITAEEDLEFSKAQDEMQATQKNASSADEKHEEQQSKESMIEKPFEGEGQLPRQPNATPIPPTMTPATVNITSASLRPLSSQEQQSIETEQGVIETPSAGHADERETLPELHTPHRKRKILTWVGVAVLNLDLCWLPISYYYALNFGTDMSMQDILAIITAIYGMISFCHYFLRSLKLFMSKKSSQFRPVGWTRWGVLEFLHLNFILAISLVEVELVVGTIPNNPWVRLVAMASPTLCYWFGIVLLVSSILTVMKKTLPFNMSSTPKGTLWRPAMLALIEDAGAIEANGGVKYRENVIKRYEVSPIFRRMILHLSWAWGTILLGVAILSTVLIARLSEDIGFGLGWGLPWATSTVGAFLTMIYVRRELAKEWRLWESKGFGMESAGV